MNKWMWLRCTFLINGQTKIHLHNLFPSSTSLPAFSLTNIFSIFPPRQHGAAPGVMDRCYTGSCYSLQLRGGVITSLTSYKTSHGNHRFGWKATNIGGGCEMKLYYLVRSCINIMTYETEVEKMAVRIDLSTVKNPLAEMVETVSSCLIRYLNFC